MLPDDGDSDFDKDDSSNASADYSMMSNKSSHGLILQDDVKEVSDACLMWEVDWCDYLAFFFYHTICTTSFVIDNSLYSLRASQNYSASTSIILMIYK